MFTRVSTARTIASISLVFASFLAAQCWVADKLVSEFMG